MSASPFLLALGERAVLDGLEVAFAEVTEESRCPRMVACVWQGRATVRLALRLGDERDEALPSIWGLSDVGTPAGALGYRFTLRALEPYPVAGAGGQKRLPTEATLLVEPLDP